MFFCVPLQSLPYSFSDHVALHGTENLEIITQLMKSTSLKLQYPRHSHYTTLATKRIGRSLRVVRGDQQANYNDPQEAGNTEGTTNALDLYF